MRCDTWWQLSLGIRLKSWTVKVSSIPPNLFARCTISIYYIYLTHLLSLHLCRAMWAQFKWLPVYELCILSRGELLRSKLKIIHSFFLYFFTPSLSLSILLTLSLKGLWLLWRLGWSVGMDTAVDTPRPPTHKKNIRFAFISAHKMHNSQISI